jgi:hypothetical protein
MDDFPSASVTLIRIDILTRSWRRKINETKVPTHENRDDCGSLLLNLWLDPYESVIQLCVARPSNLPYFLLVLMIKERDF